MKQNLLIWNGGAGRIDSVSTLKSYFGDQSTEIVEMTRELDLQLTVARAVDKGCDTVVAAGGDGTVNAVVNALMKVDAERRPKMAILPLGTANDFAGTLCIPDDISEAVGLIGTSSCLPVDVIKIQADHFERFFANVAAGGNSVRVSEELTDELKSRWGALCYLRGALGVLTDLSSFRITAECDDESFEGLDAWAVIVANGRTNAGRILVAPDASPVDGLLDVIIIRNGNALDILEIVSSAMLSNFLECEQIIFRQVKQLRLHSIPGMRFTLDGELIDREPVRFDVVPGAISMYVGPEFATEDPYTSGRVHQRQSS